MRISTLFSPYCYFWLETCLAHRGAAPRSDPAYNAPKPSPRLSAPTRCLPPAPILFTTDRRPLYCVRAYVRACATMRRCDDATMRRCDDATMRRCDDATMRPMRPMRPMRRCGDAATLRADGVSLLPQSVNL